MHLIEGRHFQQSLPGAASRGALARALAGAEAMVEVEAGALVLAEASTGEAKAGGSMRSGGAIWR